MKKSISLLFVAFMALSSMTSCYRVQPGAGQEAVLVYQPYIFGHGGVEGEPVSTGAIWCWWTTDSKVFQITPITITEEFENLIPSDNTPVSFAAYVKVQIKKGETPTLYKNFGEAWYDNSIKPTFRTMVRDKASAFKMFELASKREISSKLEKELLKDLQAYAKNLSLPVDILQVSIGTVAPPEQVLLETKLTAAQNQSILTQDARAKAELSRKAAEVNKAVADQAYQRQMNMTIDEYIHIRQLEIEKEKVELIKDNPKVTIIFGGGVAPTYPVTK